MLFRSRMPRFHGIAPLCATAGLVSGRACCLSTSQVFSSALRDSDDLLCDSLCTRNGLQMGLQSVPLNSERLGGLDIASPRPRPAREYLRRLVAAGSVSADTFWCYYWQSSLNSTRRTFPIHPPFENILGPCTQIVHTLLPNGTPLIPTPCPHPFQSEFPAPHPHKKAPCGFSVLPLRLDEPRGLRGLE